MRCTVANGRGQKCTFDKENEHLKPWAAVSDEGEIRYSLKLWNEIKRLELTKFIAPS